MNDKTYNILFICSRNSARSILAEAILNKLGKGTFHAYSAGSQPSGEVHPMALKMLQENDYDITNLRSKSWNEFAAPDAPKMDFIFTVCDQAAGEICPAWPGQPITAHWGFADPAAVEGDEELQRKAFTQTLGEITHLLRSFLNLPLDKLDRASLKNSVSALK